MIRESGSFHGHDFDGHEKFMQLSALEQSGALSAAEQSELEDHLKVCDKCREIHREYQLLATTGMPFLAATHADLQEDDKWDGAHAREQLFSRVRKAPASGRSRKIFSGKPSYPSTWMAASRQWAVGAVAACLVATLSYGSYRWGLGRHIETRQTQPSVQGQVQALAVEKTSVDRLLQDQAAQIVQAEERSARQRLEVNRLQTALRSLERYSSEMSTAKAESEDRVRTLSSQRDRVTTELQQAELAYKSAQLEIATLRSEHDHALQRVAALESKIEDLAANNRELERRVADDDRFLASDRDIRELMGARKLYIADVFDVDSHSRTRKPFGRVFYTQNKSLIFYAFDLDRGPGVKNASIFQVWGQRDSEPAEKARPTNLGILYMDSETNRRWVLRLDDPKQLAEIDAVFVTVEPHAGSSKPTGKPLLYALLRKEANHP